MSASCVPMRWPAALREPASLELLRGTPVNCLVGAPPGISERARASGIAVNDSSGATLIEGVWPGVPAARGGAVEAGPTGLPWVDANGWRVRLARARAPEKTIWLAHQPPANSALRASAYQVAIADAGAYGARWVISLDDALSAALAARNPQALETWKAIAAASAFFETHKAWSGFEPLAVVGVLSDFSGENEELASEVLNLLARRSVPYRILDKRAPRFDGLKGIVYADRRPPEKELAARLSAFVADGGFLLAGPGFPGPPGEPAGTDAYRRYNLRRVGKGRIALARAELQDPYLVAFDTQLILSRRYDLLRFFNAGALNSYYTSSGRTALLQVINYATRASSSPVSVAFARRYRTARLWRLGAAAPEPLPLSDSEVHLPPFDAYAAVELE